jgi:dihydrofolate reductase
MSSDPPAAGPRLELVAAIARNGVIGRGNALPWHLPEDLRHFKRVTLGHPVLMGRRTWESLGRPLPGRPNLVLTRDAGFRAPGAEVVHDLDGAARAAGPGALMVIGGAALYRLCLPAAAVFHLTEVLAEVDGDVRFPPWERAAWRELDREEHPADARHAHPYRFVTLARRASPPAAGGA